MKQIYKCKYLLHVFLTKLMYFINFINYRELIRFSFMSLIQTELDCLVNEWNTHRMRNNKSGDVMSGIPNELYYLGNLNTGTVYWIIIIYVQH